MQALFTPQRLCEFIGLTSSLFDAQRRGETGAANGLLNAAKILALLASDANLAGRTAPDGGGRGVTEQLLRLAHKGSMATACPRHAPLTRQERSLILPYDAARMAPCPDATLHAVKKRSIFREIVCNSTVYTQFSTTRVVPRAGPLKTTGRFTMYCCQCKNSHFTKNGEFDNSGIDL